MELYTRNKQKIKYVGQNVNLELKYQYIRALQAERNAPRGEAITFWLSTMGLSQSAAIAWLRARSENVDAKLGLLLDCIADTLEAEANDG